MKSYVFDYANDLISDSNQNTLMRDDMREKLHQYIQVVLDDYKGGFISTDEALWLLSRNNKF